MAKKDMETSKAAGQAPMAAAHALGKRTETNRSGFCIYIGPNLAGLLQSGAIFRGGCEEVLRQAADAVEKRPLAKTLIVPGDQLPLARLKVKTPGNALYENYRRLMEKEG